jgi:hypothetical protein
VWRACGSSKFIAHGWRIKVIVEKAKMQSDAWEFITKVELGKRYASQVDYSLVSDTMNGDFSKLTKHMHIRFEEGKPRIFFSEGVQRPVETTVVIPGEPIKAEVPPPIQRVTASQASPLEIFVNTLAELCRNKLLRKDKP